VECIIGLIKHGYNGACGKIKTEKNAYSTSVGTLKEQEHFKTLSLDRIILKLILRYGV
jgi:hypothetical protein